MNKQEKIISLIIGALLVWCFFRGTPGSGPEDNGDNRPAASTASAQQPAPAAPAAASAADAQSRTALAQEAAPQVPRPEKKTVEIANGKLRLILSSRGAVVEKAVLSEYAKGPGEISSTNPALEFDYSAAPLGALKGVAGMAPDADFEIAESGEGFAVFKNAFLVRKISLGRDGYEATVEDTFAEGAVPSGESRMSIGSMSRAGNDSDILSVDSWRKDAKGGSVVHHADDDSPLKALLTGSSTGGCSCGGPSAASFPPVLSAEDRVPQSWIAVKGRFFTTAMVESSDGNSGFSAMVFRDPANGNRIDSISAEVVFPSTSATRKTVFYLGPKKQSALWDLGMKDVMDFGMWRWICYPVVWLLDVFHTLVPFSYGWAVIFLTILVRLLFWPLTRKSTEGMRKMQEVQPLLKEIQAKYKDNPQRMQQEIWAVYREKKVNPLSSCLPMLVQIPVFIALFNVLRSAVELRYAPFLWISDLSEPEHLFAGWFPFGGLNILPLLMAATMFLQSKLTPSGGDQSQQKMMTVFMPIMMLVMFYNFASALSLYWTLSQVLSIVQLWAIRRKTATATAPSVPEPPSMTRQMRRHSN